ncbi:hypothetical protein B0H13DRAFT_1909422 [Mycena leptocephala]|nr:hypothetical protein B0H13DRAFT_1909422 [Mycena leptocephala]
MSNSSRHPLQLGLTPFFSVDKPTPEIIMSFLIMCEERKCTPDRVGTGCRECTLELNQACEFMNPNWFSLKHAGEYASLNEPTNSLMIPSKLLVGSIGTAYAVRDPNHCCLRWSERGVAVPLKVMYLAPAGGPTTLITFHCHLPRLVGSPRSMLSDVYFQGFPSPRFPFPDARPSPPPSTEPLPDLSLDPAFIAAARLYLPNHHPVCQAEAIEAWLMDQPITTREMGPGVRRDLLDFDGRFPARAPNVDPPTPPNAWLQIPPWIPAPRRRQVTP